MLGIKTLSETKENPHDQNILELKGMLRLGERQGWNHSCKQKLVTEAGEGVQLECLLRMFRISVAAGVGEAVLGALPPASGMKNMNPSQKQHSAGPGPMLCP